MGGLRERLAGRGHFMRYSSIQILVKVMERRFFWSCLGLDGELISRPDWLKHVVYYSVEMFISTYFRVINLEKFYGFFNVIFQGEFMAAEPGFVVMRRPDLNIYSQSAFPLRERYACRLCNSHSPPK